MKKLIFVAMLVCSMLSFGATFKVFTLENQGVATETTIPELLEDGRFSVQSYGYDILQDEGVALLDKDGNAVGGELTYVINAAPQEGRVAIANNDHLTVRKNVQSVGEGYSLLSWTVDVKPNAPAKYLVVSLRIPADMIGHYTPLNQEGLRIIPGNDTYLHTTLGGLHLRTEESTFPWVLLDKRNDPAINGFLLQVKLRQPKFANGLHFRQELKIVRWPSDSSVYGYNLLFYNVPLAGNQPLHDEDADDMKGGWFDQGSKDMSVYETPYNKVAQAVPFRPIEKAIVLRNNLKTWLPEASEPMNFPPNFKAERIGFLHATGWGASAGTVVLNYEITYGDGTVETIPVRYGVDIQDWCNITREPDNARLGWKGRNAGNDIGMFHFSWKNPHREKPLKSIRAVSTVDSAIPATVGITATCDNITPEQAAILDQIYENRPKETREASDWYPCPLPWQDTIIDDSALDVSKLLGCEPAGSKGFLIPTDDGTYRFEYEPDKPVRFWGNNTGIEGCAPPKEMADSIASLFAKQGINLLRLHMFEGSGWRKGDGILLPGGKLDPEYLDRFDYFIAALKRHGIYIYMDWNDGTDVAELILEDYKRPVDHDGAFFRGFKTAMLFSEELMEANEKWAKALYTHVNPYTGLSMVEDPAIAFYEITNENSMLADWTNLEADVPEPWLSELKELWRNWQLDNGIAEPAPLPVNFANTKFGLEMQLRHQRRMQKFLRDIGVKGMIGTNNYLFCQAELVTYDEVDYANSHIYAAHPIFGEVMSFSNACSIAENVKFFPIAYLFGKFTINGKPSMLNEWNFCYPSDFRCEGLPYMTAYSIFQGCDAMLIFGSNGSFDGGNWKRFETSPGILVLSQLTDPSTWGLMQACAVAYRRGDIRRAKNTITFEYTPEELLRNECKYNKFQFMGAMARVDNRIVASHTEKFGQWPNTLSGKEDNNGVFYDVAQRFGISGCGNDSIVSDTGEIRRFTRPPLFIVDTPCTKMITGDMRSFDDEERKCADIQISSDAMFATITVTSLDNAPITKSSRMLICAVGNSRNGNSHIDPPLVHSMGDKDVMTEPIEATISLPTVKDRPLKVYALDTMTGKRIKQLDVADEGDFQSFTIDKSTQTIYLEAIR